jgi:acyl-CoA thioesterase-1
MLYPTPALLKNVFSKRLCNAFLLLLSAVFFFGEKEVFSQADKQEYLNAIKQELNKQWPLNRTINLVFHGHSVPAGYFKTPEVRTLEAYPHKLLEELKLVYPFAAINIIVTAIGGENSETGQTRFFKDVLILQPDVIFIDYALNDRGIGLAKSKMAMEKMIKAALKKNIKIILLTPTPDQHVDWYRKGDDLEKLSNQIIELSVKYNTGLVDSYKEFQELVKAGKSIPAYMSQVNHPNAAGHAIIANKIMEWFKP